MWNLRIHFNISTNVNIVKSTTMYLHLIHNTLKLPISIFQIFLFLFCTYLFILILFFLAVFFINNQTNQTHGTLLEIVSDVPLWTLSHWRAKAGSLVRTYIQRHYADTICCPEDQPKAMGDKEVWRERVRNTRADSVTGWYIYVYIYIYI